MSNVNRKFEVIASAEIEQRGKRGKQGSTEWTIQCILDPGTRKERKKKGKRKEKASKYHVYSIDTALKPVHSIC